MSFEVCTCRIVLSTNPHPAEGLEERPENSSVRIGEGASYGARWDVGDAHTAKAVIHYDGSIERVLKKMYR